MISSLQYAEMLARTSRNPARDIPADAVPLESPLQDRIEAECRSHLWPFVRKRMDKPTTDTFPGVPDFVIALPRGRTLWCECKSRTGKQTPEQRGFEMMLAPLKHEYALVRSFSEFWIAVNKNPDQITSQMP